VEAGEQAARQDEMKREMHTEIEGLSERMRELVQVVRGEVEESRTDFIVQDAHSRGHAEAAALKLVVLSSEAEERAKTMAQDLATERQLGVELRRQLDEASKELSRCESESHVTTDKLSSDSDALRERIRELEAELASLREELLVEVEARGAAEHALIVLRQEVNRLRHVIDSNQRTLDRVRSPILAGLTADTDSGVDDDSHVGTASANDTSQDDITQSLGRELHRVAGELTSEREARRRAEEEVSELVGRLRRLTKEAVAATSRAERAEAEAKLAVSESQMARKRLAEQLEETRVQNHQLRSQSVSPSSEGTVKALMERRSVEREQMEQLMSRLRDTTLQKTQALAQVSKLQAHVGEIDRKLDDETARRKETQNKLDRTSDELAVERSRLLSLLKKAEEQRTGVESKLAEVSDALAGASGRVARETAQTETLERLVYQLQRDLEDERKHRQMVENELHVSRSSGEAHHDELHRRLDSARRVVREGLQAETPRTNATSSPPFQY